MAVLYEVGGAGGHTMSPTPGLDSTETNIVNAVNASQNTNDSVASLYGIRNWSNTMTKRVFYAGTIDRGVNEIGHWPDDTELATLEAMSVAQRAEKEGSGTGNYGWWYDESFKNPNVAWSGTGDDLSNDNYVDISLKFDPLAGGEPLVLGGYIIDTDTGYMCIKFGNSTSTATHKVAVDLTIIRTS